MFSNSPFDFDDVEDWLSDVADTDQVVKPSPAGVRFDLFLKIREIKQLAEVIQNLQSRELSERQAWLEANKSLVVDLVNEFTDESLSRLDGAATDKESVKLSVDLVTNLRQTLLSLDGLITEGEPNVSRRTSVRQIRP